MYKTLNNVDVLSSLGMQVHSSLKVTTYVVREVKKAYSMFAFSSQGIEYTSQEIKLLLYKTCWFTIIKDPHYPGCVSFKLLPLCKRYKIDKSMGGGF